MSRRASIILTVAALLVGLLIGSWSVAAYYRHVTDRLTISMLTADASTTVVILKRLRTGNTTNAVDCLESKLDGNLIILKPFLVDPHEFKRNPSNIKVLQMVRDYRTQFPHKSRFLDFDKAVAKTFDILNEQ
jgi:hypothetical protein